jgi:hypothetical protein
MKITIKKLKQIIKEEMVAVGDLNVNVEDRDALEYVKKLPAEAIKAAILSSGDEKLISQLAIKLQGAKSE